MQLVQALIPVGPLAIEIPTLMTTAGMPAMPEQRHEKSGKRKPIHGVFLTCMVKLVNGVRMITAIIMPTTTVHKPLTLRKKATARCTEVDLGLQNRTPPAVGHAHLQTEQLEAMGLV